MSAAALASLLTVTASGPIAWTAEDGTVVCTLVPGNPAPLLTTNPATRLPSGSRINFSIVPIFSAASISITARPDNSVARIMDGPPRLYKKQGPRHVDCFRTEDA